MQLDTNELMHLMQGLRLLAMNVSNMKEDILEIGHGQILTLETEIEHLYYKVQDAYNNATDPN